MVQPRGAGDPYPWFKRWPRATVVVAVLLYAGVFALRALTHGPVEAVMLLFSLPVALLAVSFGSRVGLAAGGVALALIVAWAVVDGIQLSLLGWVSRAVPLVLLGGLLGDAVDRLARSEDRRRRSEEAARRHQEAVEINDTIVQGLAVAKWALEAGNTERSLDVVTETLETAQALVSDLLRDAGMEPGGVHAASPGWLADTAQT